MAAENWTAQLHIVDGVASEDALEIAYAERRDHRGRMASLFILAEPDRPGSAPFIGELVSRIGEEFLEGEGSLTGILQRVIRERHEELLDWNRNSLPRDQASYGLSCLLVRENDVFLMQIGPCLAYYRREGRLLRRRPSSEEATGALGGSEASAPEFSQLQLGEGDWVLLISSEVASTIGEEAIGALRSSPAEDVLPALYPSLRTLARVSALVVAPGRDSAADAAAGAALEAELAEDPIPKPAPEASVAAAPPPAVPTVVPARARRESDDTTGAVDGGEADEFPERTSVGAAMGGFFAALGGIFRRRPPAEDPWAEADGEDGAGAASGEPPAAGWDPSPVSDPEIGGAEAVAAPETEDAPNGDPAIDPIDDSAVSAAAPIADDEAAVADATTEIDEPGPGEAPADDSLPDGPARDEDGSPAGASGEDDSSPETDAVPPEPGGGGSGADDEPASPGESEAGSPEAEPGAGTAGGPPESSGSVEYRLESATVDGPGVLEARAAGWPTNPFTRPAAPVLETGGDADRARFPRPLFSLEGRMLSFRRRGRRAEPAEAAAAPIAPRRGWGALALAVLAVVGVLAVVVGVLVVPDLLENSEQVRFEEFLADARRGLTAASLTTGAAAGRAELTSAQTAVQAGLELRPLDESALALNQEVSTALSQINAVVRPPGLVEVVDLGGRVPPPLALSLVQVGGGFVYLLDESGGRVFSLPLGGGEPEVIFEAGEEYAVLFLFRGPEAGAPVSMDWAVGAAGAALTILDSNGRLFRFLPGEGMRALEMPNRELIGSPDAVAVDETGIFVLDVAGGSIWRFPQLSDATLLEPQPAITRTDLSTGLSLAVADSLFVASADGRIRRFSDGADQGFPLLDLDRPLLVPASLAVGRLTGLVYAVDRGNNRVTVFTAAGELVAQLRAEELTGVRGVAPDEANDRLYFVTADALLTSTLPPIIGR